MKRILLFFLKVLFIPILLFPVPVVGQEYSLSIDFLISPAALKYTGAHLRHWEAPLHLEQPDGGFILKVLSFSGKQLYETKFILPISNTEGSADPSWFDPQSGEQIHIPKREEDGLPRFFQIPFSLVIPHLSGMHSFTIEDRDKKLVLQGDLPTEAVLIEAFLTNPPKQVALQKVKDISSSSSPSVQKGVPEDEMPSLPGKSRPPYLLPLLILGGIFGIGFLLGAFFLSRKR